MKLLLITLLTFVALYAADSNKPMTQAQADQILQKLSDLSAKVDKLSQPRGPAMGVKIKTDFSKVPIITIGSPKAPVTLVEFTDYQCPFCSRFNNTSFSDLKTNYIDTGKVRFVSIEFPLPMHKDAFISAEAAECANAQGKYLEMRERLFNNQDKLNMEHFTAWAHEFGLDVPVFGQCMDSHQYKKAVSDDIAFGSTSGVSATPSFAFGKSGSSFEGDLVPGAAPYTAFESRIKTLLNIQ